LRVNAQMHNLDEQKTRPACNALAVILTTDMTKIKEYTESIYADIQNGDGVDFSSVEELLASIKSNPVEIWDNQKLTERIGKILTLILSSKIMEDNSDTETMIVHCAYAYCTRALELLEPTLTGDLAKSISQSIINRQRYSFNRAEIYKDRLLLSMFFGQLLEHSIAYLNSDGNMLTERATRARYTARRFSLILSHIDLGKYKENIEIIKETPFQLPNGVEEVMNLNQRFDTMNIQEDEVVQGHALHTKLFAYCSNKLKEKDLDF
jgi:hypothetical protein